MVQTRPNSTSRKQFYHIDNMHCVNQVTGRRNAGLAKNAGTGFCGDAKGHPQFGWRTLIKLLCETMENK